MVIQAEHEMNSMVLSIISSLNWIGTQMHANDLKKNKQTKKQAIKQQLFPRLT